MSALYTEERLVSGLKERDKQAFEYLYDNYSKALYNIVLQIVNDAEISNDLLQEVFVSIWRKIDTYDVSKGRLFTWMLSIARNAALDTLRSKSFKNSRQSQSLTDQHESGGNHIKTEINIDNIGLSGVVNKLEQQHRVLIDLAYFKGYTHEEISKIESIPLGTVKTRIRKALLALREQLK